jgi:hypothetical protein
VYLKADKMFRESDKNPQFDAFSSPATLLQGYSLNYYLKKDSWHNVFREQVAMRINEDIFKCLYCSDNGSPNASLRVLTGMMILKEGQGWSDEQLFEQCRYNLLVRSALGVMNLTDTFPAASTYYLFRKRIAQYNRENDLYEEYGGASPAAVLCYKRRNHQFQQISCILLREI